MENVFFNDIDLPWLFYSLFILLVISAFFSGSETGMMSLNRYRLKHMAKTNKKAKLANKLLSRPDRLLGVILIGNNFINISASAIATIIGGKIFGDIGIFIATITLTFVLLLFSEILPKTIGALYPERVALPTALPLQILLWILFPIVWLANVLSNNILKLLGMKAQKIQDPLSIEELKVVFSETNSLIPSRNKRMLTSILDLQNMTVDDIIIPRIEVTGINIEDSIENILLQLKNIHYNLLPIYKDDLENIIGTVSMRDIYKHVADNTLTKDNLNKAVQKPHFVPAGTSLYHQLTIFQRNKLRMGWVVDEYGAILGLITLADILEEIVGEFTTDTNSDRQEIRSLPDGSFIIDGSINLRALNRTLDWKLPTDGMKTLSGLIIEHLETIPEIATCVKIADYKIEIISIQD
ncbi:MAG: HlyC/CorC family transporter, partial [Romboutsia sp.]|nr:HlyC/CorC family transporter [Romboutsia sp.]